MRGGAFFNGKEGRDDFRTPFFKGKEGRVGFRKKATKLHPRKEVLYKERRGNH